MNPNRPILILARAATACVLVFAAIIALEHALVPRLEPIDHMVSEYANAGGLAGAAAVVALLAWSTSLVFTTLLTAHAAMEKGGAWLLWAMSGLILLAALGLVVAALFPTQAVRGVRPRGVSPTSAGQLHDLGGSLAQVAIFLAVLGSVWAVRWSRSLRCIPLAAIVCALILGPMLAVFGTEARGLRQRTLIAVACTWELGLLSTLASRKRPRSHTSPTG
ncbi:MAG TPA: DUF998 domain-containing protein [Solirubrobacteraceae bacterium]|nr:DUF998 domain-containing protein [Solirubrobacteraceae bacterium]